MNLQIIAAKKSAIIQSKRRGASRSNFSLSLDCCSRQSTAFFTSKPRGSLILSSIFRRGAFKGSGSYKTQSKSGWIQTNWDVRRVKKKIEKKGDAIAALQNNTRTGYIELYTWPDYLSVYQNTTVVFWSGVSAVIWRKPQTVYLCGEFEGSQV